MLHDDGCLYKLMMGSAMVALRKKNKINRGASAGATHQSSKQIRHAALIEVNHLHRRVISRTTRNIVADAYGQGSVSLDNNLPTSHHHQQLQ